jgi:hypothetical protein
VIAHASEKYQLRSAVLIGQDEITNGLVEELEALKTNDGVEMGNLLSKINCISADRNLSPCPKKFLLTEEANSNQINRLFMKNAEGRVIDFVYSAGGEYSINYSPLMYFSQT